jgi:hypothetical protein
MKTPKPISKWTMNLQPSNEVVAEVGQSETVPQDVLPRESSFNARRPSVHTEVLQMGRAVQTPPNGPGNAKVNSSPNSASGGLKSTAPSLGSLGSNQNQSKIESDPNSTNRAAFRGSQTDRTLISNNVDNIKTGSTSKAGSRPLVAFATSQLSNDIHDSSVGVKAITGGGTTPAPTTNPPFNAK